MSRGVDDVRSVRYLRRHCLSYARNNNNNNCVVDQQRDQAIPSMAKVVEAKLAF